MISSKGRHFPKDVILFAVFFYVRYAVSYHDLEEFMAERGVLFDHATLNRWVIEHGPLVTEETRERKQQTASAIMIPDSKSYVVSILLWECEL